MATTLEILFEAEEIMREILNATRRDEFEEALRIVEGPLFYLTDRTFPIVGYPSVSF